MNISGNISNIFPHIFNRPFIPVILDMRLSQFSVFLALGPEIFVDGLIVLDKSNKHVVGRIGSKNILSCFLKKSYSEWQNTTAEQIMERVQNIDEEKIEIDTPVSKVLELFQKTKLAFTPIIKNDNVVAVLTIRDFLQLVKNKDNLKNTPISNIASKLTTIDKNTDILIAIDIMLKKGIRNIGLTENGNEVSKVICVINDRNILEFLLSYNGRQIIKNFEEKRISHIKFTNNLKFYPIKEVEDNTPIKVAANLLADMENPFVILKGKDKILTPWDVVLKSLSR